MANVFKSTTEIVQEMCDDFKSITGITLTPDQVDDANVIKFYTYAGALSSFYAQIQRVLNDVFPTTSTEEGLRKHLQTRSLSPQIQPSKSHGQIKFTLTAAASIGLDTQVKRKSDGAIYQCIQAGSLSAAGDITLFFESVETGNSQNLDVLDQPFDLLTPISGVNVACVNASKFLDGRDLETAAEMQARIIAHDRDDNSGGNAVAYETWAKEASTEVVTAKTIRLARGPDTVDTYITSGTTDISAAVENGQPVTRLPSATLLQSVQAYIVSQNPVTDDHLTKAPTETPLDVTFKYNLINESVANRAYVDGIISKVIKTYIYSARPQDILSPTDIERSVDKRVGDLLKERHCLNLGSSTTYYVVPDAEIKVPGTITLTTL